MSEMSDRLQAMLSRGQDDTLVTVNVMLEAGLKPSQAESVVKEIAACVADQSDFEYLANMNMVLCTASLRAVRQLAKLSGVIWIDLESRAPLEAIMDPHRNDSA